MVMLRKILLYLLRPIGVRGKGDLRLLIHYRRHLLFTMKVLRASKSQIGQDVFVACQLQLWKQTNKPKYFVEFGATDGITLSNTYILEKIFDWDGLLIEPARIWREHLIANRNCKIDFRCVFDESGKTIQFNESVDAVYSTIDQFSQGDQHAQQRNGGERYLVDTVSLNDVLTESGAPLVIDYLSIDTEGSELQILQSVDFSKWKFKIITVEHNFMPQRILINQLLLDFGYKRVFKNLSQMDDWYVQRGAQSLV